MAEKNENLDAFAKSFAEGLVAGMTKRNDAATSPTQGQVNTGDTPPGQNANHAQDASKQNGNQQNRENIQARGQQERTVGAINKTTSELKKAAKKATADRSTIIDLIKDTLKKEATDEDSETIDQKVDQVIEILTDIYGDLDLNGDRVAKPLINSIIKHLQSIESKIEQLDIDKIVDGISTSISQSITDAIRNINVTPTIEPVINVESPSSGGQDLPTEITVHDNESREILSSIEDSIKELSSSKNMAETKLENILTESVNSGITLNSINERISSFVGSFSSFQKGITDAFGQLASDIRSMFNGSNNEKDKANGQVDMGFGSKRLGPAEPSDQRGLPTGDTTKPIRIEYDYAEAAKAIATAMNKAPTTMLAESASNRTTQGVQTTRLIKYLESKNKTLGALFRGITGQSVSGGLLETIVNAAAIKYLMPHKEALLHIAGLLGKFALGGTAVAGTVYNIYSANEEAKKNEAKLEFRAADAKRYGSYIGTASGMIIGGLLGGPLGIAIGSWIGSSAGNIIGGVIAKKYEGLPQNSTFKTLGEIEEGQRLQHLQSIITSSIKEIRESSRNPADVDEEIIRSAITEGNIAPILNKISAIGEQISTTDKNDPILAELQKEKEAYMLVLGKIDHLYESARNLSGDQLIAQQNYASQTKESHWYTLGIPINKGVIDDSRNLFDRRIPVEKSGSENVGVGVEALKTTDNITSALKELGVDLSLIGNDLGGSADSFLMQLQERASIRTGDTNMSIETDRFFKVMQQLGLDTTSGLIKKMSQDTVLMEEIRQYVEANTGTGFTTESGLQLLNALISSKRRINERHGRHIEKPTSVVQPDTNIEVNIPEKPSVKGESSTMVETVTSPQQPERVEQSEQNAVFNTEGFTSILSALSSSTEALRRRYETSPNEADINTGFRPINVDLKEFSSAFVAADVFNKYLESIDSTSHQVEDIARVALEVARDKDISISESTDPQVIFDFLTSVLPDIAKKIDSSINTADLVKFISDTFKPVEPATQPAQTPPREPIASLPPTIGSVNVDFDIEAAEAEFARLVNGVLDNKSLRAASLTSDGVNPLVEALLLSRKEGENTPTGENVEVQVNPTVEPTPTKVELNVEKPKDVTVKDIPLYDILQFQYQEYYPIFDNILKLLEELKKKGINMGEGGGSSESNGGTGGGSGSPGGTPFSNGGGNTAEGGSYNPAPVGGRLPSGSATLSSQQMQTQLAGFQTMNVGSKTILAPTGYNANSYNRVKDTNLENWMAKQLVEGGARVSSRFGTRNAGVAGASKVHGGMDFAAATGTNIKNFVGGKVIFSGQQRDKNGNLTGYGNYVRVQGDDGNIYTYGHMSARGVKVGDRVEAGAILGQVGNTGTSGGSHLHMDVTRMVNGKKVYLPTEEVGRILMNAAARGEGLAPPIQPSEQPGATPAPQGGTTPPTSPTQPDVVVERVTRGPTKQMQSLIDQHGDFIAEQAKKYNIPVNMLLGQIQQESGGNANATSRVGAVGLMQLMPGTAKDLGVTDRTDPRQSIAAGARYMGQLMKRYNGNMDNALMAYNWGMGNVDKYLKGQKTSVPKEAREYAERVRARAANYTVEGGTSTAPTQPNQPPTDGNAPTTQPVAPVTPTDQTSGITPPAVVAPTEPSVNPPAETGGEGGDRVLRASTVSIQAQTASLNAKSMTGEEAQQNEEEGTNPENPPAPVPESQTTPGANVETPPVIPPIEPSVAPINPSENPSVVTSEPPIAPAITTDETSISTAPVKENPDSLASVLEEARNWKMPEPDRSTTVASLLSDINDGIIAKNPIANPELFKKYSDEDRILDKSAVAEAVKSGELSGAEFNSLVRQEIFNEQIRKRRGIGEQPETPAVPEETVTKEKPVEKKVEETVETVVEKPAETVTAETQTDITSEAVTPETTLVETAPPTETKVVETPESQVIQLVESPTRTEIAETPETRIESQTVTAPVKETKVYLGENAEGYLPTPDTVTDEQLAAAGLGRAQYARYYGAQPEAIRNKLAEDMGLKAPIYAHRPPEETVAETPETVVEEKQPTLTDVQVESPTRTAIAETPTKEVEQNITPPERVETVEAPTTEYKVITTPERVESEVTTTPESQSVIIPEREQKVYLGEEAEGYLPPPDKISDEQLASIGRSRKQYEREYGTPTEPIRRHLANEMGLKLPIFGNRPPEETITPPGVPTEEIVTPEDISSGTTVVEERPVETPTETTTPSWRDRLSSFGEAASNMYKATKEKISDAYSSLTGALTKQLEQPTPTEEITAPEKPSEPTTEGIVTPEAFKVDLGPNVPEVKLPEMENVGADITPETTTIVPPTKPLSERVREGLSTGITLLKDKISSMYEAGKETVANMYEAYKNGGVTEEIPPENPEAPVKPEEEIATQEIVPEKPEVVTPETTNAEIPSEQPQITPETPEAQIVTPEKVEPPKTTETQVAPVIPPATPETPETPAEITTPPTEEVEPNTPTKNPLFTTSSGNDIITDAGLASESTFTIEATEDNPNALGYNTPGFTPIADNGNIYRQMYNTAMAYSAASGQDNIFMGDSWLAQEARVKAGLQERNTALDNFSFKNIPEFQKGSKATFEEKYKALWGEEPTAGRLTDEELASLGLSPDTFKHGRKREEEILKERAAANTTETEVVAPTDAVSGVNPPDQTIIPPTTEEAKTEILTPAGEAMPDIGAAVAETESARVRAASTGASEGVATSVSNGLEGLKDVLAPQQRDKSGEGVGETLESGNGSAVSEEETRAVSEYVLRYIFGENANGAGVLNIF